MRYLSIVLALVVALFLGAYVHKAVSSVTDNLTRTCTVDEAVALPGDYVPGQVYQCPIR